jgi:hypothetical protein
LAGKPHEGGKIVLVVNARVLQVNIPEPGFSDALVSIVFVYPLRKGKSHDPKYRTELLKSA